MSDETEFTIDLCQSGTKGAAFRLKNSPGQLQRANVMQEGTSGLTVQGNILSILHGKETPDGPPATLIVFNFRFIGSESHRRRFRKATIDVQFAHGDERIGSDLDPQVTNISFDSTYVLSSSMEQTETTISTNISGNAGFAGLGLGLGAGWEQKSTLAKETRATLSGYKWIEGRDYGEHNTAKWILRENEAERHGVPSVLRTAILVTPQTGERFRAIVKIDADVDWRYDSKQALLKFQGKRVVDPVWFDMERRREPMGPIPANVDTGNLRACDLNMISFVEVGFVSLRHVRGSDREIGKRKFENQLKDPALWLYKLPNWGFLLLGFDVLLYTTILL
jgi:hypothetical protein